MNGRQLSLLGLCVVIVIVFLAFLAVGYFLLHLAI